MALIALMLNVGHMEVKLLPSKLSIKFLLFLFMEHVMLAMEKEVKMATKFGRQDSDRLSIISQANKDIKNHKCT